MNDTPETTELLPITGELLDLPGLSGTVSEAIGHAVAAGDPIEVGDYGILVRRPAGYVNELIDARDWESEPREVRHLQPLVGVSSFARYVNAHQVGHTRIYLTDVYGSGTKMLTHDTPVANAVIDDHPNGNRPGLRGHHARLVFRPTAAARRWGNVLEGPRLTQEGFLELVVDGVAEIANPDASVLRDLISDLHAIRTAEVQSVIRTGGQGSIQLADNVKLSAGTANRVEFPETITLVLNPFAGIPSTIQLLVRVVPTVVEHAVMFKLTAPGIEDELATVIGDLAVEIEDRVGIAPLWTT
jgi:hypothetical protein